MSLVALSCFLVLRFFGISLQTVLQEHASLVELVELSVFELDEIYETLSLHAIPGSPEDAVQRALHARHGPALSALAHAEETLQSLVANLPNAVQQSSYYAAVMHGGSRVLQGPTVPMTHPVHQAYRLQYMGSRRTSTWNVTTPGLPLAWRSRCAAAGSLATTRQWSDAGQSGSLPHVSLAVRSRSMLVRLGSQYFWKGVVLVAKSKRSGGHN
jgi:hypothetical protein